MRLTLLLIFGMAAIFIQPVNAQKDYLKLMVNALASGMLQT
jgi:hypothetical protein